MNKKDDMLYVKLLENICPGLGVLNKYIQKNTKIYRNLVKNDTSPMYLDTINYIFKQLDGDPLSKDFFEIFYRNVPNSVYKYIVDDYKGGISFVDYAIKSKKFYLGLADDYTDKNEGNFTNERNLVKNILNDSIFLDINSITLDMIGFDLNKMLSGFNELVDEVRSSYRFFCVTDQGNSKYMEHEYARDNGVCVQLDSDMLPCLHYIYYGDNPFTKSTSNEFLINLLSKRSKHTKIDLEKWEAEVNWFVWRFLIGPLVDLFVKPNKYIEEHEVRAVFTIDNLSEEVRQDSNSYFVPLNGAIRGIRFIGNCSEMNYAHKSKQRYHCDIGIYPEIFISV